MFEIAKLLVTGVAKDDRIAVNSRDYTALTGGQDPEPVAGMVGGGGSAGGLRRGDRVYKGQRGARVSFTTCTVGERAVE